MALKLFSRKKPRMSPVGLGAHGPYDPPASDRAAAQYRPAPYEPPHEDPLARMAARQQYAAIVRDEAQWSRHAGSEHVLEQAKQALECQMALVPAGSVAIAQSINTQPGAAEQDHEVEPFLLDIHCVTNARFQNFVDAGGYDALEYWPEEIWPHLIELKDLTGQPGPRFWRHGRHDLRFSNHPVVGVSWYEAQAYALWVGQRLPTETEWQMAGSWHIKSSADVMRRFPWGDAMDANRCNVWASRVRHTVPVDAYPNGAAPNHVLQLVGNVWEWTDSEYVVTDERGGALVGEMPMHVIRGGAFDTYFESQTSTDFRTGQIALARAHNTGFRCAMDLANANWLGAC
jgi:iron(II)-dependent oxidoreductase